MKTFKEFMESEGSGPDGPGTGTVDIAPVDSVIDFTRECPDCNPKEKCNKCNKCIELTD